MDEDINENELFKLKRKNDVYLESKLYKNNNDYDKRNVKNKKKNKKYINKDFSKCNNSIIILLAIIIIISILLYILLFKKILSKDNKEIYIKQPEDKKNISNSEFFNQTFLDEIDKIFKETYKVNINSIESKFYNLEKESNEINSIIHIGFTLDSGYVLETMFTMGSILKSQKKTTKIIFHFGVVRDFSAKHMIKMYELKSRINNLSEYNFYYLKESMEKMAGFHQKGEACPGKFELPQLLSDDIERLLIFDGGDLLVFRDLTDLFNYDMGEFWALGVPEPWCIEAYVKRYNRTKYLNIGSVLLKVRELKNYNFWDKYTKSRDLILGGAVDQTLFNIVLPDERKNYFPFKFGGYSIICTDKDSETFSYVDFGFKDWLNSEYAKSLPDNPKTELNITAHLYNPVYIHVMCGDGKWNLGKGLSIYRHLVKYFIQVAGIWDELCNKKPGYCS